MPYYFSSCPTFKVDEFNNDANIMPFHFEGSVPGKHTDQHFEVWMASVWQGMHAAVPPHAYTAALQLIVKGWENNASFTLQPQTLHPAEGRKEVWNVIQMAGALRADVKAQVRRLASCRSSLS